MLLQSALLIFMMVIILIMEQQDKEDKREILKAIADNKIYGYIYENFYKLNDETIKELLLEFIYVTTGHNEEITESLKIMYDWEE